MGAWATLCVHTDGTSSGGERERETAREREEREVVVACPHHARMLGCLSAHRLQVLRVPSRLSRDRPTHRALSHSSTQAVSSNPSPSSIPHGNSEPLECARCRLAVCCARCVLTPLKKKGESEEKNEGRRFACSVVAVAWVQDPRRASLRWLSFFSRSPLP